MSRLSQRRVDELVAQIGGGSERGCNVAESVFLRTLERRRPGAHVLRHGWPDFLVEHGGRLFAVEVKNGRDRVSVRQRAIFELLEKRLGLEIRVWHPDRPGVLAPWRSYVGPRRGETKWPR